MSCDECSATREELETYKRLYRDVLNELRDLKNLLYYMRPGDIGKLLVLRREREDARLKLETYKKELDPFSKPEDLPQVNIKDFTSLEELMTTNKGCD